MDAFAIFIISLCSILTCASSIRDCCRGENVLVNGTCIDGLKMINISCSNELTTIPSKEKPHFRIETGKLILVDEYDMDYVKVDSQKYCISRELEHNTTVIPTCIEKNQVTYPTLKAIIIITIKAVCALISVLFILPILIIYSFIPVLRDLEGKCIINLILGLFIAFILILFIPIIRYLEPHVCNTTTFIHFTSIICCYNWLTVLSFHLWRITIRPAFRTHMQWFPIYFCYGYGLPIILLITTLTLYYTLKPNLVQPEGQCWVDGDYETSGMNIEFVLLLIAGSAIVWGYFYGPIMITLLISSILQLHAAKKLWRDTILDDSPSLLCLRKKSLMYLHLLLIMGQAKIIDIITYVYLGKEPDAALNYLWQVCDCRNLLVGGVLFFIFVILRNKVLKALAEESVPCIKFPEKWKNLIDEEDEELEKVANYVTLNE